MIGVEDSAVQPIRGQTILVEAPKVKECVIDMAGLSPHSHLSTYINATIKENTYHTSFPVQMAPSL